MKRNIDKYLKKFLNGEGYLFIDNQFNEEMIYRFYFRGLQIYIQTSDPDVYCSLGSIEKINPLESVINYKYEVDCLLKGRCCKNAIISVINSKYTKDQISQKLLAYLNK